MSSSRDIQAALRDATRKVLGRLAEESGDGPGRHETPDFRRARVWEAAVTNGWTSMHVPTFYGGSGGSFGNLGVVLEEIGRVAADSPLLGHVVLGIETLMYSENDAARARLLPRVASGALRVTVAGCDPSHWSIREGFMWSPQGSGLRLRGGAQFVIDGDDVEYVFVRAQSPTDGETVVCVPARLLERTPVVMADGTRRISNFYAREVFVTEDDILSSPGRSAGLIRRVAATGALAMACDSLGLADYLIEVTVAYALTREQFGIPIGGFQAVKHRLANLYLILQGARAAVEAALELYESSGDLELSAAAAKSFACPGASAIARASVELHGAIGFTWESGLHRYLKRATLNESLFGRAGWHRAKLATAVLEEGISERHSDGDVRGRHAAWPPRTRSTMTP